MALDAVEKEDLEAELLKLEEENRFVSFLCVTVPGMCKMYSRLIAGSNQNMSSQLTKTIERTK